MAEQYIITIEATNAKKKIHQTLEEELRTGHIKSFSVELLDFEKRLEISESLDLY